MTILFRSASRYIRRCTKYDYEVQGEMRRCIYCGLAEEAQYVTTPEGDELTLKWRCIDDRHHHFMDAPDV